MANPHGSFIWYELMTPDPDAAKRFYTKVVGWTIARQPMPGDMRLSHDRAAPAATSAA